MNVIKLMGELMGRKYVNREKDDFGVLIKVIEFLRILDSIPK